MNLTHDNLVNIGRKWLSGKSPVVVTEIRVCWEQPDIIGFRANIKHQKKGITYDSYGDTLIECKASRSDFKADSKKSFRSHSEMGLGQYRYYLTPKGLVNVNELPDKWGLLETSGKNIRIIKIAKSFHEYNIKGGINILVSTLQRLKVNPGTHISLKVYSDYGSKNTTTLTLNKEIHS